jgi:hypothetical protein
VSSDLSNTGIIPKACLNFPPPQRCEKQKPLAEDEGLTTPGKIFFFECLALRRHVLRLQSFRALLYLEFYSLSFIE